MSDEGQQILQLLQAVAHERQRRSVDDLLAARVTGIKVYQHARFEATYGDMLGDPPTRPASLFFLNELYGPKDFTSRDQQFARVVPKIIQVLPKTLVSTVLTLARLHALSEELDTAMGNASPSNSPNEYQYGETWRIVGRPDARQQQIDWMHDIGLSIDAHARKGWVRTTLRMMRGPAQASGFGALQAFLESGLEAFRALPDARGFLSTVAQREAAIARLLFQGGQ
jgi:hypothetical protein